MEQPILICVDPDGRRRHQHVDFQAIESGRCLAVDDAHPCGNPVAVFEEADRTTLQRARDKHGVHTAYRILVRQGLRQWRTRPLYPR